MDVVDRNSGIRSPAFELWHSHYSTFPSYLLNRPFGKQARPITTDSGSTALVPEPAASAMVLKQAAGPKARNIYRLLPFISRVDSGQPLAGAEVFKQVVGLALGEDHRTG